MIFQVKVIFKRELHFKRKPSKNVNINLQYPTFTELSIFSKRSNFSVAVSRTRSPVHLTVDSDPFVCDPLGSYENRTSAVFHSVIIATIFIHVPPQHNTSLAWPNMENVYLDFMTPCIIQET